MKSNFTQALRELTGFDGQPSSQAADEKNGHELFASEEKSSEKTIIPEQVTTINDFSAAPRENTK